jgi:hypothetical protein
MGKKSALICVRERGRERKRENERKGEREKKRYQGAVKNRDFFLSLKG